jgi:hypothetical protein
MFLQIHDGGGPQHAREGFPIMNIAQKQYRI